MTDDMTTPVEPGSPEWEERLDTLLLSETTDELGWYWLSFVDPAAPIGSQFLGVAIVEARGAMTAVTETHRLGINPGGEVAVTGPIPPNFVPDEQYRNRLMSQSELGEAGLV